MPVAVIENLGRGIREHRTSFLIPLTGEGERLLCAMFLNRDPRSMSFALMIKGRDNIPGFRAANGCSVFVMLDLHLTNPFLAGIGGAGVPDDQSFRSRLADQHFCAISPCDGSVQGLYFQVIILA